MAILFLLLAILLIIPNFRLFSAVQPPISAPTLPPPIANSTISSISTPPPSQPPSSSPPIITNTPPPPPPPPLSLPPTTTINPTPPLPPPQQIQLNNIIDALIGAGDFAGWANILSNTNPSNLPVSATFFIPGNNALSHLPTSTASGSINFDPFIFPYHIIPQRLSFSDLLLFKTKTRLPTLLPTKSILITDNSPTNFSVDNSPITHPDMYTNSAVTVHGIETILDYTIYGGNPFQPPVQQTQNPSPEAGCSRSSDLSTTFTGYQLLFTIICAVLALKIDMGRFNETKMALFLCGLCFAATAHGISLESCVTTYNEGGAPAIFQSPNCTQWVLMKISQKYAQKCDLATMKGFKEYQEDRMACILDIKIPSLDSKADSTKELRAKKLTRDHHPDEKDERARIDAAGGFVQVIKGVPRVNGRLAVSEAIGDIALKRYGVIAEPEVKGWQKLTRKDRYLVIASDGIFERYTPDRVSSYIKEGGFLSSSLSSSIASMAFISGSKDNLSVIFLPLRLPSRYRPQTASKDEL